MTSDFGNIDRQDVQELTEDQLLTELDCPVECPDLTRSIMGRLGYMKASPNVVRRARILRHVNRGLLGVAAMVALGVGIFIHNHGPDARRQVGPSLSEAMNNALLQALAVGIPIIATDAGDNPTIVRDGREGLIVPVGDAAALAQAMLTLAADPELRCRLAVAARVRAGDFAFTRTVQAYEDLYEGLLSDKD
ncbi:MAG: glycosyltransferase family 4 protein [Planctomycetes bacterium]|nr:glycosyltransferase family 4 protein [Planctomycetota bacterium]